ncbi:hypothetical protein ACFL2F_01755 [Myxococcota bacterium]
MSRYLIIPGLLLVLLTPGPSRAEMWDFKAGIGPVYGSKFSRAEQDGLGFQAYCELGLSDVLSLTAGGGYTEHFIGEGSAYSLTNLGVGLLYNIDVLVVVPFLSLRMGWLYKSPDQGEVLSGLGVSVAIGFDYLVTETFTLGFAAEYHGMLTEMEAFPAYAAFTGRVGFRLPN